MTFYDLFMSLGHNVVADAERRSTLLFALTEALHVLGIALLGGSVLASDLSALGLLLTKTPPVKVWRALTPFAWTGLIAAVVSGLALVSAGPLKYYTNWVFPTKIALLTAATLIHIAIYRHIVRQADGGGEVSTSWRVGAGLSLFVWTSVILAGRAIGLI